MVLNRIIWSKLHDILAFLWALWFIHVSLEFVKWKLPFKIQFPIHSNDWNPNLDATSQTYIRTGEWELTALLFICLVILNAFMAICIIFTSVCFYDCAVYSVHAQKKIVYQVHNVTHHPLTHVMLCKCCRMSVYYLVWFSVGYRLLRG